MTESLTRTRPRKPESASVAVMHVVTTARVSAGFVRVTLRTDPHEPGSFEPMGYDQWFRLFLPVADGGLELPLGDAEGWYTRWLALDEARRCMVRNYTVRAARPVGAGWEIDVDFVVHLSAHAGTVEGVAAAWALGARPGDTVGMLDQGIIFAAPETVDERILILADESGLPGVEGVVGSLAPGTRVAALLEVAHAEDRRELPGDVELDARWAVRGHEAAPGSAALSALDAFVAEAGDALQERAAYCYVVGEGAFVLEARRRLRAAGVPKDAIDFCAYWRAGRRAS